MVTAWGQAAISRPEKSRELCLTIIRHYLELCGGWATSVPIQVTREIPLANWLRPAIRSTNHGGKQGGINLIVLDQPGPTPVAECGQNSAPDGSYSVGKIKNEELMNNKHPYYK